MSSDPLRIYAPRSYAVAGMSHIPLLYPFWGPVVKDSMPYVMNALVTHGIDGTYFSLVERIEDAEYVVVPHDYWRLKEQSPETLARIREEARVAGKSLLIDASGDRAGGVNEPNSTVLRIHQYRFALPPHEIKMPVPCEDLLEVYAGGVLAVRKKQDMPVVGFAGWAQLALGQRIRSLIKELPIRLAGCVDSKYRAMEKGVFWRERVNAVFLSSKRLRTNFLVRASYSGHVATVGGAFSKNRQEFVENIRGSDYALIVRGDANEATRFYEALSLGRIPVVIDTAIVFPAEDVIDYREFCVIIDHRDWHRAPDILADFHKTLSPERFASMQKRARAVFEEWLRYDSFTPYLVMQLRARQKMR